MDADTLQTPSSKYRDVALGTELSGTSVAVSSAPAAAVTTVGADKVEESLKEEVSRIRKQRALIQEMYKLKEEEARLMREENSIMSQFQEKEQ